MNSQGLISAVQSRGSDAGDARDAAHEAAHSIRYDVDRWDRESIHAAIAADPPRLMVQAEIEARQVERIVCERLGIEYDVESWAFMAAMETMKNGIHGLDLGQWVEAIGKSPEASEELAREILSMSTEEST